MDEAVVKEVVQEEIAEIVADKVEERLEEIVAKDKLEDVVAAEKVEDRIEEIVADKVEDKLEEVVAAEQREERIEEVIAEKVEDKLEEIVAAERREERLEEVVAAKEQEENLEEIVVAEKREERLEEVVAAGKVEDTLEDIVAAEVVAERVEEQLEKKGREFEKKLDPPPYSEDDPIAQVQVVIQEERQPAQDGTKMKSVLCALIICLGSFSFGTVIGYPSPAMLNLANNPNPFHLNPDQQSWFGSIVTLLALFGGLMCGPFMDYLGRKTTILIWSIPFCAGWITIMASNTTACVLAGRAITGLCMGILSVVCPVYIGEIAPPSIRGLLGSCHQMAVCLGILFIDGFGTFLPWNWAAFSCECWLMALAVCVAFIPESPRWLLSQKRKEETMDALLWLRGDKVDLKWEMMDLEEAIALAQDRASLMEFLQPKLYKPMLISLGLMLFQQFSGINVIMFYGSQIFDMAGIDIDPNIQNIIVAIVGVVGTLVSVFISDLAGRRVLLLASAAIMTLSIAGMGAFFYEKEKVDEDFALTTLSWLPVTALVLFNFGFNVAFGPIPWLMMSEIFPLRAKALASSVATACNWTFAFLITYFWADMTAAMSNAGAYWFCTAFCALAIPFTILFVPETRGRTLEEITSSF